MFVTDQRANLSCYFRTRNSMRSKVPVMSSTVASDKNLYPKFLTLPQNESTSPLEKMEMKEKFLPDNLAFSE